MRKLNRNLNRVNNRLNDAYSNDDQLDDIPGRIMKSVEGKFSGLKKPKPIYEILNLI